MRYVVFATVIGLTMLSMQFCTQSQQQPDEAGVEQPETKDTNPETEPLQEDKALSNTVKSRADVSKTPEDILKKVNWGNVVFNVPDSMRLQETYGIHLILSPILTVGELKERIDEQGRLRNRRIRISRIMEAQLKGSGFHVEPITDALQYVDMRGTTEWRWQVTPIAGGEQFLYLTMNAIVTVDGQDRPHTIHSLSEQISVYITWQQRISGFVAENWQWLWTTVVVPFLGWAVERRRRKRAIVTTKRTRKPRKTASPK